MGVRTDLTVTISDADDDLRVSMRHDAEDERVVCLQGSTVYATLNEIDLFAERLKAFVAHQRGATENGSEA